MKRELTEELLSMAAQDLRVREELATDGSLFDGYNPTMRAVHERNADRLEAIIADHGWPAPDRVGHAASEAAWLVAQHAISRPALMRKVLELLRPVTTIPAWQLAMLEDRIRVFEGREQLFGTQFDWDENGEIGPHPIEDPDRLDARRSEVGLPPMAQTIAAHRARARTEAKPTDLAERRAGADAFAREVGWR